MESKLTEEQLADAFERIAQAVDRAGAEQESSFLARLALALAARLDNPAELEQAIREAERAAGGENIGGSEKGNRR